LGNNKGLVLLLLGIGALYVMRGRGNGLGAAAPYPSPAYYPGYQQPIYFPSQAPIITLHMEGLEGGPVRPPAEDRLITTTIEGKRYHTGYTREEMAWRRARPARAIGRAGGGEPARR